MIQYPKIPNSKNCPYAPCIAFEKYDGSNLRFEWTKKSEWCKYGTRRRLFDESDEHFGSAIEIFHNTYADKVARIFTDDKNYKKVHKYTVFAEFFGPRSFGGLHRPEDEKELIMFDIWQHKYGLIGPRQFINDFDHVKLPRIILDGKLNGSFIHNVRDGKYNVKEGVVCKGGSGGKKDLWMCKVKTNEYLQKLKDVFHDKWRNFWE